MPDTTDRTQRGREAERPADIPAPGWKDVALRVKDAIDEDNLSVVAGGVAFWLLLAGVPAMGAGVALYGLFVDPSTLGAQLDVLKPVLPEQGMGLIEEQLKRLVSAPPQALGLGATGALLVALWSATRGTKAMIAALNIAYEERERRGFVKLTLLALGLTLGLVVFALLSLALLAVVPSLLSLLGAGDAARWGVAVLRWPILGVLLLAGLAALYRWAPCRAPARWRWISPGALVAALLWLIGSAAFSVYVAFSGSYDATYGSLGAVVVLMMWLYVSAFAILIGAEINSESERQTRHDTTTGAPEPMGRRQAWSADTVGESAGERSGTIVADRRRGERRKGDRGGDRGGRGFGGRAVAG